MVSGIGNKTSYLGTALLNMRAQIDDLQRQLATGKKSTTYAGEGIDRGFAVGLRAKINTLSGYANTATNVQTRLQVASASLTRLGTLGSDIKKAADSQTLTLNNNGQTVGQISAQSSLAEAVGLMNTRAGDRYLFSGRATDTPATADIGAILDGSGAKAGLKQLILERKQADVGTSGLGRLVVSAPTASSMSLAEDIAGSPFGMKLNAVTSSLAGATVTGPTGSPPAISVDFGVSIPAEGEKIKFTFNLPDGTSETVELTATATTPLPANGFSIGATPAATVANLQSALTGSLGKLADTSLVAASAMAASANFFGEPPQRVATAPFGSATGLVAGTDANTVSWYTGEKGTDPARGTATARVDDSISVQYGARANEQAIRWQIQNIAVFAAVTTTPLAPNASAQISALNQRVSQNLSTQSGQQSLQNIQSDFSGAQTAMKAATSRQTQGKATAEDMLEQIEGVSNEEVLSRILALQTSLEASYQTTSMLYQTTLTNYI